MTFVGRRAFDVRVVFDSYFPGLLPAADAVPRRPPTVSNRSSRAGGRARARDVDAPIRGGEVESRARPRGDDDAHVLGDIEREAGGSPFDNRNVVYQGSDDDVALNALVARYAPNAPRRHGSGRSRARAVS